MESVYFLVMSSLSAEKRNSGGKLNAERSKGRLPAVYYGRKEKSTPIWISEVDFGKVLKVVGESSVVDLKFKDNSFQAIVHEIDRDPVTDKIRHVDFYVVEKDKKLEVSVPINFVGVSPAVKDLGGILVKVLHELKIEAFPKDLPHSIDVDISWLVTFDDRLLAKDIVLPSGVTLKEVGDEVVATVDKPREEKEEEAAPVDISAIEVEKKGKEETAESEEGTQKELKEPTPKPTPTKTQTK